MTHTPSHDEAPLNRETRGSEELEPGLATASRDQLKTDKPATPPPLKLRRDPAHREILRRPFLLD